MKLFGANKKQLIEELQAEVSKSSTQIEKLTEQNEVLQKKYDETAASMPKEKKDFDELNEKIQLLNKNLCELDDKIKWKTNIISQLDEQQDNARNKIHSMEQEILDLSKQISCINEEINMQEYGIYRPVFEFANSDLYKDELKHVRDEQKAMIKNNAACSGSGGYSINGSLRQGNAMVRDMKKLLLRAFNLECDDIVANVTISNRDRSIDRINKSSEQISKLGKAMSLSISPAYIHYKIKEVELALDFAQKKAEEKERIRELKAQQREEAKVQKEIEEARKKLEKERSHYQNALKNIVAQLDNDPENKDLAAKKAELEAQIEDTEKAIADVDYREANKRAGYVYVISNIGAFGEDIYKIGMTRRLDPMDRVHELGDASVPFNFDVHALIFTEDAPGLESALHTAFEDRKVNKINPRREFFYVSLDEIKKVVRKNFDKTVEWIDIPQAEQYRQSLLLKQEYAN